jgi:hypothetical protein
MAVVKESRISVSVGRLKPGWLVDRDIIADRVVLVTAGTVITERMIDAFQRRGIERIEVSLDSALARTAPRDDRQPDSPLAALLRDPRTAPD